MRAFGCVFSLWNREASSSAPGTSAQGVLVRPGSQHSAALRHFFEHLLIRLLFDESPIELVEPSADALLALVLADESGFSELIQQVPAKYVACLYHVDIYLIFRLICQPMQLVFDDLRANS